MSRPDHQPQRFTPQQLAESRASEIYVSVTIVTVIAVTGVSLRCLSRRMTGGRFAWDDWLIITSLAFLLCQNILTLVDASLWGLGRHLPAVIKSLPAFLKSALAIYPLYYVTSFFTKASLLALYYRLFSPNHKFRWAIYITAVIIFGQSVGCFFATIFRCIPVAGSWNRSVEAKCVEISLLSIMGGALNLATDTLILCLPLPVVWSLQMNKHQKITLTAIFLLGAFVCVTSIVRIAKVSEIGEDDFTWIIADAFIWTSVESSIGVFCACLPTLRPLFQRIQLWSTTRSTRPSAMNPAVSETQSGSHSKGGKRFIKIEEHPLAGYDSMRGTSNGSARPSPDLEEGK